MPLDDALTLLQKEYDTYMALEKGPGRETRSSSTGPASSNEDHTFMAPSRNMVSLLRMLADSRILSIGELDEIASFVQERKRRLEGRHTETSADARNGNTTDLKSRILNMLYPQANAASAVVSSAPPLAGMNAFQSTPSIAMGNTQSAMNVNPMGVGMANPAVQQALDSLMQLPADRYSQQGLMLPQTAQTPYSQQPTQQQPQPVPSIDAMNRYSKGSGVISGVRAPPHNLNKTIASTRGTASDMELAGNRSKVNTTQQPSDNRSSGYPQRYSTYGPPQTHIGDASKNLNVGGSQGRKEGVTVFKPDTHKDTGVGSPRDDDSLAARSRSRKRGKRGGAAAVNRGNQDANYTSPDANTKRPYGQTGPVDLMSANAYPTGSVGEGFRGGPDAGFGYPSYGGGGPFMGMGPSQSGGPFYMPQTGYYPGPGYY